MRCGQSDLLPFRCHLGFEQQRVETVLPVKVGYSLPNLSCLLDQRLHVMAQFGAST